MQLQKLKVFSSIRGMSFLVLLIFTASAFAADVEEPFRTPAKLYGGAYSVKLVIKRKGFEYELPVWIKPDQKESSLDRSFLTDMGWIYPDLTGEEVSISGEKLNLLTFKSSHSDWANRPQFKKTCCYGIIGQDILKDYELTFIPTPPAHIEWVRISQEPRPYRKDFLAKLKSLFSIRAPNVAIGSEKEDLSKTPYTLDLSKGALTFQKEVPAKPVQ